MNFFTVYLLGTYIRYSKVSLRMRWNKKKLKPLLKPRILVSKMIYFAKKKTKNHKIKCVFFMLSSSYNTKCEIFVEKIISINHVQNTNSNTFY